MRESFQITCGEGWFFRQARISFRFFKWFNRLSMQLPGKYGVGGLSGSGRLL